MNHINLTSLRLTNIMCFEQVQVMFDQGVVTSIKGINNDDDSSQSNGSGKSALLEGFTYGLSGNTIRVSSSKKLLRNGCNSGEVELLFTKNGTDTLEVKRELNLKGKSNIYISINGELREDLVDLHPRESNKAIIEWIGISYEDINETFILHKDKYKSFLKNSDSEKKNFISRFCGVDLVDDIIADVAKDIAKVELELSPILSSIVTVQTRLSGYDELIEEINSTFNANNESAQEDLVVLKDKLKLKEDPTILENKANLELELSNLETRLKDQQALLKTSKVKAEQKQKDLDAKNNTLEKLSTTIDELKLKNAPLEKQIRNSTHEKASFSSSIVGEVECPECNYHFIPDAKELKPEDIKEIELLIEELDKNIESTQKLIDSNDTLLESKRVEETTLKTTIRTLSTELSTNNTHIKSIEKIIEDLKYDIEATKTDINDIDEKIKSRTQTIKNDIEVQKTKIKFYQQNRDERIQKGTELISKANSELSQLEKDRDTKQIELNDLNEVSALFSSYKTYLINQFLKSIESIANGILHKMKTPITISIEGIKELASKEIRDQITINGSTDGGLTSQDVATLSSGERAKIEVAFIEVRQRLIENATQTRFDLTWLDEICESADSQAMSSIIDSCSQLGKNMVITTHSHPNEVVECSRLTVEKTRGKALVYKEI